jgi:alpha-1,2-mannosyltransferase
LEAPRSRSPPVSKIFPGVLGLLLVGARQWRAVASVLLWSIALTVLAWTTLGSRPFVDFFAYQVPRIESGDAFFWIEDPGIAPVNQSLYGLVTKLRLLGVPWTDRPMATATSNLYGLVVVLLGAYAAWRLSHLARTGMTPSVFRLRQAQIWLALLSLASLRSPFVPDTYGLIGSLWLLTLLGAEAGRSVRTWTILAAAAVAFSVIMDGGVIPSPVPTWIVLTTLAIQTAAIGINVHVVLRREPNVLHLSPVAADGLNAPAEMRAGFTRSSVARAASPS